MSGFVSPSQNMYILFLFYALYKHNQKGIIEKISFQKDNAKKIMIFQVSPQG